MVISRRTLVPRLKQLARMVLSSFASCGIKGKLIDYCLYQHTIINLAIFVEISNWEIAKIGLIRCLKRIFCKELFI